MAKVGLKDTLALIAKGYSKKEIDALAAIDEEQEAPATDNTPSEAPAPVEDKKAPEDAAKESIQEPDYKSMYEELLEKNKQSEAKITKLQQANVHTDSAPASEEAKKKQEEDLQSLFRSYM